MISFIGCYCFMYECCCGVVQIWLLAAKKYQWYCN